MQIICTLLLVTACAPGGAATRTNAPPAAMEALAGPFADSNAIPDDPAGERHTLGTLEAPTPFDQALLLGYGSLEAGDHMVCKLALAKDEKWWATGPIDCGFSDNRDHTSLHLLEMSVRDDHLVVRWALSMRYANRDNDGLQGVDYSEHRVECVADAAGTPRCSKATQVAEHHTQEKMPGR